jgi:NDP-sugar pyrophosphorylase family protein
MTLGPGHFFNIAAFEHRMLYGKDEPVWAALAHLNAYLGTMLAQSRPPDPYRTGPESLRLDATVRIENPWRVLIAPTAIIKPYTVIEGDAIIDDGAVVGPHAYLRGGVIIGRNARVGHCSEIKHSVLFPFAKAPHHNVVLDSLIGWNVNLAAGLRTMNKKANDRAVAFRLPDGRRIDTELRKLGIIAGDGSFFGGKIHFNPGDWFLPMTRLI